MRSLLHPAAVALQPGKELTFPPSITVIVHPILQQLPPPLATNESRTGTSLSSPAPYQAKHVQSRARARHARNGRCLIEMSSSASGQGPFPRSPESQSSSLTGLTVVLVRSSGASCVSGFRGGLEAIVPLTAKGRLLAWMRDCARVMRGVGGRLFSGQALACVR